ncbi:hypothetical protein BRC74_05620 [Halobacteriales archaeon QH_7_68_42]|nr:MAG: hypothetical protein BRC74_05620 [Halobacteriales archaeon QH_7_68_42]
MTERDALGVFDAGLVTEVAGDHDIDSDRLSTLARTHQSNVRDLPGVDDIVYEWRTQFHQDPLLARTSAAYYLALPDHVWDEFAEDIGASEAERAALVDLHGRQTRIDADEVGADTARLETSEPVVLTRP